MKKIIASIIGMLLTTMIFCPIALSIDKQDYNIFTENVDQKQELTPEIQWLDGEDWQQFKHGGGTLTKVDVHIGQYYSGSNPMTLSIEASVGSVPLTDATLGPLDMPSNQQGWVSFDVNDIELNANQKYYIVLRFHIGSEYAWSGATMDPYPNGLSSVGPSWDYAFRTYTISGGLPPNKPNKPSGQINGIIGTSYEYQTSTIDPNNDQVWYKWDWGDEISEWDGPYNSGDLITKSHTWTNKGSFSIKVKAKDTNDQESVWSDPLSVSMPKNKEPNPYGIIFVFGLDVEVKIVQLEPGEDYIDLEVLNKPFYILENDIEVINPGAFIRLLSAKGLFSPAIRFCFGICQDWGIIG